MNRIIFSNTEQDLKDMNLTIEDIKMLTAKINNVDVIIINKGVISDGKFKELQ